MDSQYVRSSLYEFFSTKEFTRKLLDVSGILAIVLAGLQFLSVIINPLSWLSFGGAANLLMIIALIFAFASSNFKMIFIALGVKLVSIAVSFFKMFTSYYYGFSKFANLIGYIVIIAVYTYLLYLSIKRLQSTGEWQSSINDIKNQVNQGVNNFQNSFNNANFQNGQNQQYKQAANTYADANRMYQGNGLVYKPISTLGYIGYMLLFAIPFIGFIILIVFAVSAGNQNLKNFARSYFCFIIIIAVLIFIVLAASGGFFLSRIY